ncbi:MAG: hypothetical protein WC516_01135 [Patescibacteria group bacterium]
MKETRRKTISNKIFTKIDIRNIYKAVYEEYKTSDVQSAGLSIRLLLDCQDGVRYESESDELLSDGDIIDIKKCTSINIEYYDYKSNKYISVIIRHGDSDYYNDFTVSGSDRNWVSGTFDRINIVIGAIKPQSCWLKKFKSLMLYASAILLAVGVYKIIYILLYQYIRSAAQPPQTIKVIIEIFFFWLLALFPILIIEDWVLKLWPSVEFDFGPEHQKAEKNKRKRLWLFFSVIAVPLLLASIYDLIKKLLT